MLLSIPLSPILIIIAATIMQVPKKITCHVFKTPPLYIFNVFHLFDNPARLWK